MARLVPFADVAGATAAASKSRARAANRFEYKSGQVGLSMWIVGCVVSFIAAFVLGRLLFRRGLVEVGIAALVSELAGVAFLTIRQQPNNPFGPGDRALWIIGWMVCIGLGIALGAWSNAWGGAPTASKT